MGIAGKFITIVSCIILLILTVVVGILMQQSSSALQLQSASYQEMLATEGEQNKKLLDNNLMEKGNLLADALAATVGDLIWNMDNDSVQQISKDAEQDRDVDYVAFFDDKGVAITQSTKNIDNDRIIEREIHADGNTVGTLKLYLNTTFLENKVSALATKNLQQNERAKAEQQKTNKKLIYTGAILSLIGIVALCIMIYILFGKMIVTPLSKAQEMAVAISQGQLSIRLPKQANDEIGKLSLALNGMADGLTEKVRLAEAIGNGDLTVEVKEASNNDEFGLALKRMVESLNGIVDKVRNNSNQIAIGAGHVSETGESLSKGSTETASALEEISASINQIAAQTTTMAENANTANTLSIQSRDTAKLGNQQMESMIKAMGEMNESSQNISKIIKVIDEIAFQTNLLALNAAVEAARAGQHGKGFAVVAEEVRNLAARSAKAASETAGLIEGSVAKTQNGVDIADKTATALGEIVGTISKVTDIVADIAIASNEQAQGIAQINTGLGQIDQVTQQNTASAEESAASSVDLSNQAEQLQQILGHFKVNMDIEQPPLALAPASTDNEWGT